MQYIHTKHFSLAEAQEMLPKIIPILETIINLKLEIDRRGMNLKRHQYFGGSGPNGEGFFPTEMEDIVLLAQQLEQDGIFLKSFDSGLIDFPHIRSNGEEVYLCFQLGERNIEYFHDLESGFAGRTNISEL